MVEFPITVKMGDWEKACEFCYESKRDKAYKLQGKHCS
jgi:hypothetical protein